MSLRPDGLYTSLTSHDLDAWLLAAQQQCAHLHLKAMDPWISSERYAAFAHMADLLLEAFEEIRVVSAQLREDSDALRCQAEVLCQRSQHLAGPQRRSQKRR
jgi:hypothetical protein